MAAITKYRATDWGSQLFKPRRAANVWGLTPAYEGSTYGRRTAGWAPGNDSVNTALFGASDTLRARSRDIARKNGWASHGVEEFVSEVIGTGISPRSQHSDPDRKKFLQQLWMDWTDYCDYDGIQDFYGLQGLVFQSMLEGGECFIRFRTPRRSYDATVPLQLQVLEAEHCPTWKNETLANGNVVRMGIEFDRNNQRVAYWLYPTHPGERGTFGYYQDQELTPVRVPATYVLHIFKRHRPGQVRGEPWLSRALLRLFTYDQYTDAELVRKNTAAQFAAFITELDPVDPVLVETPMGQGPRPMPPSGINLAGLEPGTVQKLRPGEDIKFSNPADVGANFAHFNRAQLMEIAAAIGITYEQLTGDLSNVNFSSLRAGLLGFRRKCTQIQHFLLVFQMCRPIWMEFIESAVFAGAIPARDYKRKHAEYLRVRWMPSGWSWVDPLKDQEAAKQAIRSGLRSQTSVVAELGHDIEEVFQEIADEQKLADKLGIIRDTDPRQTAGNGSRPERDPTNPYGLESEQQLENPEALPAPANNQQES
jgi:lambda family phage portal protein